MLSRNKRRIASSSQLAVVRAVPADTDARLCDVARASRERLRKWAEAPLPDGVLPAWDAR